MKDLNLNEYMILEGMHPVLEALYSDLPVYEIMIASSVSPQKERRILDAAAGRERVKITKTDRRTLDTLTNSGRHRGVVAFTDRFKFSDISDMLSAAASKGEDPFLLILDGIMDPQNLGAILRTADLSGVHGVIIREKRACDINFAVFSASAGAANYLKIAKVTNISQTIKKLKECGIWIASTDMSGPSLYEADLKKPLAVVIGNEGKGVSKLVSEKADFSVSIPTHGHIDSLNASVACGIVLFEARRQRDFEA